jgi:L-cysteine/cystine lyase
MTVSGQKWLCGPDSTGALVVADPERLRVARPSFLSQTSHEPDGAFVAKEGAPRFETGWLSAGSLAGLLEALALPPEWSYRRAAELAARCRELLAQKVEVARGDATLVAFRPEGIEPEDLVARLTEQGVVVRFIPKAGLVRVSVGWWTSEDDLRRLAAAL